MSANPILYASISRGPTVLADLLSSSAAADLPSLASVCRSSAPQFHLLHTHTANSRIYAFLIAPPLVFFAISDESLGRPSALLFLRRLRDATVHISADGPFHHLCLQEELGPVIRRFAGGSETEDFVREEEHEISVMDGDDDGVDLGMGGRKSAERIWWGQVGMVVVIDLVVCGVLFGVWLGVCKGFECVRG